MNFEEGEFFSIYSVGEKLGHGHFAEVKHCVDINNKSEYAAKFIRLRQSLDSKSIGMSFEEIEREAHILKMLNHQNIIKLFYCYDLGKNVVLVLELVAGGELFDHISDSEKLSEEEASEFIEQILLGVQHMHERKVVHLDLKPENVMIEDLEERKIKLIDFGLAREIIQQDTLIEMQGTAEFLAPEVINYNPISYATDMWSIGVISYIMLTGVSPFSGDDQFSTFQNIINCRLDFEEEVCSDMSEMAKSFINSLLVLNPKNRATANSCMKHPWIKPLEQATVFRRRSSIISRDKLQLLKQFVVYPSPPNSTMNTPRATRKTRQELELFEDTEECNNEDNDNDLVLLSSATETKRNSIDRIENNFSQSTRNSISNRPDVTNPPTSLPHNSSRKMKIDQNQDSICKLINSSRTSRSNSSENDVNCTTSSSFKEVNFKNESGTKTKNSSSITESSMIEEILSENSLSPENSSNNSQNGDLIHSISFDPAVTLESSSNFKQKFNNSIANSVKKLNSKFENIISLFDSSTKSNSTTSIFNRKSSLKNTSSNQTKSSGLLLSSSDRKVMTTERSVSYDKAVKFTSSSVSTSEATSPTVSKRNLFVSRYMAHIESKKK